MRKFNSLREAISTIAKEQNWLIDCFKMVPQFDCVRKWCYTNGAVCFEIDTKAREVNFYNSTKFWSSPVEIVGIN